MKRITLCGLVGLALILHCSAQGVITTVAGSTWNFSDHFSSPGPALNAPLGQMGGVAVDSAGNVFGADGRSNNLVVRISPGGILTVVAGNGQARFSGDGGSATSASLSPQGVAVDATGNLYIADDANHRIRKVTPGGTITTVAGNGVRGFSGDGGPATSARLNAPQGVAVDSAGNLYIADTVNWRVRKVDTSGTISTVTGNGVRGFSGDGGLATNAQLNTPNTVALDAAGNLYIADSSNHRIRKVSTSGTVSTVAGSGAIGSGAGGFSGDGGPATGARLNFPTGVAVDTAGNLYIADYFNSRIRKVTAGGTISTAAGNGVPGFSGDGGPATSAQLDLPAGVALDPASNLYILDNSRIRKVDTNGTIATLAGNGMFKFASDGGAATSASLNFASSMAVDAAGNLSIADTNNNRIRKVSAASGIITTVAGNGIVGFSGDGGPATSTAFSYPGAVAVDAAGNLSIADTNNNRIRKVSAASGIITTVAGNGIPGFSGDGSPATSASLANPQGVAVDAAGNLYIADASNNRIRKVNPSGVITTVAGNGNRGFSGDGGPATSASLAGPLGVALDAAGNLHIADTGNNRVRKVTPGGTITTLAGSGIAGVAGDCGPATSASLNSPQGVALDAGGNLYIADYANHRTRKVSPSGIITTVAGNGEFGFSGDGGPATRASLFLPSGVAVDTAGNLYIADSNNDRIRKVVFPPASSSVAPTLPPDSVVNAASFRLATDPNGAIAPGGNVAVFGTELAFATQVALSTPLGSQLLDSCVVFSTGNNVFPAPLFFVSGGQMNAQVPFELPPGTASVQVRRGEKVSPAQPVKVAAVSPGIFSLNQQGTGAGAILHAENFQLVSESNPARPGEFVILFGTGLGAVQPAVASGQPAPRSAPLATTVSTPVVNIGGIPAAVVFSGLAPGFVGLYQVNVQAPMEVPSGTQPLQIIMSGVPSNTVTVAVSQ